MTDDNESERALCQHTDVKPCLSTDDEIQEAMAALIQEIIRTALRSPLCPGHSVQALMVSLVATASQFEFNRLAIVQALISCMQSVTNETGTIQ